MKSFHKSWVLAAILVAALATVLAPGAAAQMGSVSGSIMDVNGKPWAEVTVRAVSDQGAKQEIKTDGGGKFTIPNLRPGIYTLFILFPPPNDKQAPYEAQCRVQSGEDAKVDLNFKDIVGKQGAAAQEQVKKAEEAKSKMEGLKAHFTAGNALIDQEKQAKIDLQKAPADQRDALKQKLNDLSDQAVKEFQEASKNLVEKGGSNSEKLTTPRAVTTTPLKRTNRPSPPNPMCRGITTTWATCWHARERSTKARPRTPRARNLIRPMPRRRGATLGSACTTRIAWAMPSNR